MTDKTIQFRNTVLDAVDAGLIVLDRSRRITQWNRWMVSATGHSIEAVIASPLNKIFPDIVPGRLEAAIGSALDSGVSSLLTHALHPLLFPLKTRAGRELLHDVTVAPIGAGPDTTCLIHVVDVTMAVRRERYLRERQNARYDAVVASAPDAILTLDGDGVVRFANPAASVHLGYPEKELIGMTAATLFGGRKAWNDTWRGLIDVEKVLPPVELTVFRKDGSMSYFEVSASRWQNDSRVFVTAIFRDVMQRRADELALRASEEQARAAADALADLNATLEQRVQERTAQLQDVEETLRQSQKMEAIGQLTGGIAHDFNNLLQGITGALNMLQKRVAEGRIGDVDRFLTSALSSAERASALTHRLLAFSRRQPVDPRPVDMNLLIGATGELLRRSIGETINMKIFGAEGLGLVRCDPNQMENAILNLAINARDAMPDGGTLTISTSNRSINASQALIRDVKPGDYVEITVSDNGVGMASDVQTRAFDPFYTTKPFGQGTGLGLSMIYGFVRQSQGAVWIESQEGKGTTVVVCLPKFYGELEPEARTADDIITDKTGKDEIVLVVEDDNVVRLLVVEALNDLGYHSLEAADGRAALKILQTSQRIDLLVTDIGLPEINGRQVADAARIQRSELKVLFMTGYAESAASSNFLESGMQIISKPFTMDALMAKIEGMI